MFEPIDLICCVVMLSSKNGNTLKLLAKEEGDFQQPRDKGKARSKNPAGGFVLGNGAFVVRI